MPSNAEITNGLVHDEASIAGLVRSSALCDACQAIFTADPAPEPQSCYLSPDSFVHHHAGGLEAAINNGCALCRYLEPAKGFRAGSSPDSQWWLERGTGDPSREMPYLDRRIKSTNEDLFMLSIYSSGGAGTAESPLDLHASFIVAPLDKPIGTPFRPKPDPSKLADLVARWLADCQDPAHWQCVKYRSAHRRKPLRVLEVLNTSLRLRELSETEWQGMSYITLSHRWTTPAPPKLGRENADEYQTAGISLACLPQMFQDAAEICRWLRVKYLWIDSLCIYQDSAADWEREAGMMGDIYGGALLNIAATDAGAACDGIIPRQRVQPLLPVVSSLGNPLLRERGALALHLRGAYEYQVERSILLGRGWVHQEVCVAPATLFMTATQAWWRCGTATYSETYPGGLPSFIFEPHTTDHLSLLLPWATGEVAASDGAGTIDPDKHGLSLIGWRKIVMAYSEADFTIESDRPVALAGVVNMVASVLGSYYCGMWYQSSLTLEQNQFLYQLFWQPPSDVGTRRANTLRGSPGGGEGGRFIPTWSWASIHCMRYVPGSGPQPDRLAHLVRPPPIGKLDRFGWPLTVEDATLHIAGVLVPVFALRHDFHKWGFQAWPCPLQDPLPSNGQLHGVMAIFDDAQELAEIKEDAERSEGRLALRGLFFLVTQYSEKNRGDISGLVVRARDWKRQGEGRGRKEGVFSRAGVFFPHQCCGYPEEDRFNPANQTALFNDFQIPRYGKKALETLELPPEQRNLGNAEATLDDIYLR